MQVKFFTIPVNDPADGEKELNAFLRGNRVLEVIHEFVADGANSRWCLLVQYLDGPVKYRGAASSQERIDYKNVLDETAFARFCALRKARKAVADAEGVPAFALFTDKQMAELAGFENLSLADMEKVKGLGPAKVEKYGPAILRLIKEDAFGETNGGADEKNREPV